MEGVRATKLLYVENDPALRGIMSRMLAGRPGIDLLVSTEGAEVLDDPAVMQADVALIDLALGHDQMNGIDLGIALRALNENIGIVIHSQYETSQISRRLPQDDRMGWSIAPKSGDLRIDDLIVVLRSTAAGMSSGTPATPEPIRTLAMLSDQQRAVMSLAAKGLSARGIATQLGRSDVSVRQDLSRAYRALVPELVEGDDPRTRAVLEYRRLVSEESWNQG